MAYDKAYEGNFQGPKVINGEGTNLKKGLD